MTNKRHETIHESPYGDGPNNFHIAVHGRELHVDLTYPPRDEVEAEKLGTIRHVVIDQESVRASDGIRVHYDYQRDGFVIEQASTFEWNSEEESNADNAEDWQEVAFVQSWARQKETQDETDGEAS